MGELKSQGSDSQNILSIKKEQTNTFSLQGFAEAFLEHLWKKLQDPNNPAVIRQAAGNYIGSLLARAKFIPLM